MLRLRHRVKDEVWKAVRDLGEWLKVSRHADVKYCWLPQDGDKNIAGLDDYLAAEHARRSMAASYDPISPHRRPAPSRLSRFSRLFRFIQDPHRWTETTRRAVQLAGHLHLNHDPDDLELLTLWAAHTHLIDETYTTPGSAGLPSPGKWQDDLP